MKRFIVLNIIVLVTFCLCITFFGFIVDNTNQTWIHYQTISDASQYVPGLEDSLELAKGSLTENIIFSIISGLAIIGTATVFILINPQIFRKGRVSEVKAKLAARQEQAHAEKARVKEERKAAKIAKLEQELKTLKKEDE